MAYNLINAEKLDIASANKEHFEKLGKQIGRNIKIGRVHPEQLDETNCILCGYVK